MAEILTRGGVGRLDDGTAALTDKIIVQDVSDSNKIVLETLSDVQTLFGADEVVLGEGQIADISGANTVTFVSPIAGTVKRAVGVVSGNPGAETDIAMDVDGGTASTDLLTIANGASAGEVDTVTFTDNNTVAIGSVITFTSDAAATNAVSEDIVVVLAR